MSQDPNTFGPPAAGESKPQLVVALELAGAGVPVFHCRSNKVPFIRGGFKNATTDTRKISEWWREHPDALIGVPTGAASGLWVLDEDIDRQTGRKLGAETAAAFGLHEYRYRAETRSGGGHYFFRWESTLPRNTVKNLPGLDSRGEGGYVIAWNPDVILAAFADPALPSPPERLLTSIRRKGKSAEVAPRAAVEGDQPPPAWVQKAFDSEVAKVCATSEGSRQETLNTAAFVLGQIVAGGCLDEVVVQRALLAAARGTGLPTAEAESTIARGLADGRKYPRTSNKQRPRPALDAGNAGDVLVTEDSVAMAFSQRHRNEFLYDHSQQRWLRWVGTHWAEDKKGFAFHCIRRIAREFSVVCATNGRVAAGKASFAGGAERFVRADPEFARTSDSFDIDPWALGTPSGAVDLQTGMVGPARPEDMITRITSIAPAETSDCPMWKKFLDDTTGGDKALIRFLQQWLGYSLTGITREHALVFIHGSGGNGKSVFLAVAAEIFGDYAMTASMDTFTASSFERHTADVAMLCGARLVTASETESGKSWAESRIKQMTGGDPITARFMRQNFFTYTPQFKLTIVGNHEPALRNVDEATERRFNIVPFTRKPPTPDKELLQKLRAEYPAILRWMIEGCLDWQANGLMRPEAVTSATADYFEGQDLIGQWLDEKCDLAPGDDGKRDTVNLLFASWINFAELAGEKPGSKKTFGDVLVKRGVRRHKGAGGVRYMLGVTLKPGARPHSSRSTTTL